MKIRMVSHLLENSGYGKACREIASALSIYGVDLTCNPVVLGKPSRLSEQYLFLESYLDKNIGKPDYILQFVLPHHFQYNGNYKKNAGYCLFETSNLKPTKMFKYTELMDEIYSPTTIDSAIKNHMVPLPINLDILKYNIPKMRIKEIDHTYKFYTICDYSRRKNIWASVRGFLRAFNNSDNVSLVIKISSNEMDPQTFKTYLEGQLKTCVENCGIRYNDNIIFITERFDEQQILSLHKYCDCYITTSFGEAWNYPMVDALVLGKQIISSLTASAKFFKRMGCKINLVDGLVDTYHGETDRLPGYHTLYENCINTNEVSLSQQMKQLYKEGKVVNNYLSYLEKYTPDKIGKMICERLAV